MELSEIREKIDKIDDELLDCFLQRMELAKEIARVKEENSLPVLNKTREREILDRVMAKSGDMSVYSHRLYSTLFELSRSYQTSMRKEKSRVRGVIEKSLENSQPLFPASGVIAVQGVEGAYSQMAADRLFPRGSLVFFKNFDAVFSAVSSGLCSFGVLPIENSSNGSVRAVYELLRSNRDLSIVRTARLCISHSLLVKPGVKLSEITEIHSHAQALGQCSSFLKSLGDNVNIVEDANTAVAAEFVANSTERTVAAISSSDCAALYGLESLDMRIQDSDNNYTRFICIAKDPCVYEGADKITLILALDHKPGALYDVLSRFSALELNLIKLESCPMVGHDFEFLFFFEIEASIKDEKVVNMLEELERICPEFSYMGNYSQI